jgi:hypothetical protein
MKKFILALCFTVSILVSRAEFLLVPMDMTQTNHIKAYGSAFQSLKSGNTVQWLLNYRGGAFLIPYSEANETLLKTAGVNYEKNDDKKTQEIVNIILLGSNNMNLVSMNRVPKIAVYAPSYAVPYDDAVTIALKYAGIEYTQIYDREVLKQDLAQYDWIHLDHEDFTGQYNKWQSLYSKAAWFTTQKAQTEAVTHEFGFNKVSQMKLAVAKKLRSFVENGGQLFAMCAGTEKLDIALAAEGVDIVASEYDGDPADFMANSKLNYENTFAFQNFTVVTDPAVGSHSSISVDVSAKTPADKFALSTIDAKKNLMGAMLVQDHVTSVKEFLGNTTAFKSAYVKPSAEVLAMSGNDVKYLHGQRGLGYFTFLAGHDPEDFKHLVGNPATKLENFKQSAGYRLILNNILFQSASNKTLAVSDAAQLNVKTYPNPFIHSFTFEINSSEAKDAKLNVYNLNGQIMISEDIKTDNGYFKKEYNTDAFSAGLYIVEVSNAKGIVSKTLLSRIDQ